MAGDDVEEGEKEEGEGPDPHADHVHLSGVHAFEEGRHGEDLDEDLDETGGGEAGADLAWLKGNESQNDRRAKDRVMGRTSNPRPPEETGE